MQVTQPLSDGERLRFEQCRTIVRTNLKTCFEVGAALMEIRDGKLYREHWKTFEAFCQAEFSMSRRHADRLIEADAVKKSLPKPSPEKENETNWSQNLSESHARELKNVPVELRNEVLEAAAATTGGEPTATAIREAAAVIAPTRSPEPPKPVIELDRTGFAIPEKLVPFWERRREVQKLLDAVSLLRTRLREGQEADDLLYRPIASQAKRQTWTELLTALDKAYAHIGQAMPYAVCPYCQGRLLDTCTFCQQRGFVSEFDYNTKVPAEDRRIRETQCSKTKIK